MASEKQIAYIRSLMKGKSGSTLKAAGMTMSERAGHFGNTSTEHASNIIENLIGE